MNDWREMKAGRKLDYLVGELRGLEFYPSHGHPAEPIDYLIVPQGTGKMYPALEHLPAYSTSVDAALTLLTGHDYALLNFNHQNLCLLNEAASKDIEEAAMNGAAWEWSDTPALAVCRAWLAWRDMHS